MNYKKYEVCMYDLFSHFIVEDDNTPRRKRFINQYKRARRNAIIKFRDYHIEQIVYVPKYKIDRVVCADMRKVEENGS